MAHRLTKSTFVKGWQCPNLLWWEVHEPDALELAPDIAARHIMEQGKQVDRLAREYVPGGVPVPGSSLESRLAQTQGVLGSDARAVYGAAFEADQVFVAVDILERTDGGFTLVEVKATNDVKDEHIPDAAIQTYVLKRCGVNVVRSEVMHLNRECRHPDLSNLFVREDVTARVRALMPGIPRRIAQQLEWLDSPEAPVSLGAQCFGMKGCPFLDRCWPERTGDHVRTLYRVGLQGAYCFMQEGIESIQDLPVDAKINKVAQRQVRAVKQGARIIGPKLEDALAPFESPVAFLDFETVGLAIPAWPGCRPWEQVPVQFSCHVEDGHGGFVHHEWLAEGAGDQREPLARALIDACSGAKSVAAYWATFERQCIEHLATALPHLSDQLDSINARLVDLHPVVKDHVYDPGFEGSFSLKSVIPALVPELSYDDLDVAEGLTASALLARMMFEPESFQDTERAKLRKDLLAYCKRDTEVMVGLLGRLRGMGP
jgi:predicted RecB family nuclease